jgi:hypothetical protein
MTDSPCLRFSKPYSLSEFSKQKEADLPGIYIWGFVDKGDFIPYYVGESTTSVKMRVLKHKADILKEESTYRRLKSTYTHFYSDPSFPAYLEIPKGHNAVHLRAREWAHGLPDATPLNDEEWFKNTQHFKDSVYYYNQKEFFPKDTPLKEFSIKNLPASRMQEDVLRQWIEQDTFRVMFWTIPEALAPTAEHPITAKDLLEWTNIASEAGIPPKDQKRWVMEVFETLTKFSLKGKTGSTSITISEFKKRWTKLGINPATCICADKVLNSVVAGDLKYQNFTAASADPYIQP